MGFAIMCAIFAVNTDGAAWVMLIILATVLAVTSILRESQ